MLPCERSVFITRREPNTCVEHLRLGMTAHGDVPETRDVFVVVLHAGLSSDYSSAVAGPVRTRCTLMRLMPRALAMALGPCPSLCMAFTFEAGTEGLRPL